MDSKLSQDALLMTPRSTQDFFPNAHHFVVSGGQFTSNVTQVHNKDAPSPSGFRTIPLGDLELLDEIQLTDDSSLVNRHKSVTRLLIGPLSRRNYSARVNGRHSDMTVAVYQGQNAEEEWRQDVTKYSGVRHPKFLQVYGVSGSSNLYATVFHEDLIPLQEIYWMCRRSALATAYLDAYFGLELSDAETYIHSIAGTFLHHGTYTSWIRRTTGRLCVDLSPSTVDRPIVPVSLPSGVPHIPIPPLPRDQDAAIIEALTLRQHQEIIDHSHNISLWSSESRVVSEYMKLGALIYQYADYADPVELAAPPTGVPTGQFEDSGWKLRIRGSLQSLSKRSMQMRNGWTRFDSFNVATTGVASRMIHWPHAASHWLPQANYILSSLNIASNYDLYRIIYGTDYYVSFSGSSRAGPKNGYLFLCPLSQLCSSNTPAYWSLDPTGNRRLNHHRAMLLGFPALEFKMKIWSRSWDEGVYAGLRQFHRGKGFDPDGQDVARHLGLPIYTSAWIKDDSGEPTEERYAGNTMTPAFGDLPSIQEVQECGRGVLPQADRSLHATAALSIPATREVVTCSMPDCLSFSAEKVKPQIPQRRIFSQSHIIWILSGLFLSIIFSGYLSFYSYSHVDSSVTTLAIQRVEKMESWLPDDALINLIDLLKNDVRAAAAYNAIEGEGIRVKWVRRQLGVEERV